MEVDPVFVPFAKAASAPELLPSCPGRARAREEPRNKSGERRHEKNSPSIATFTSPAYGSHNSDLVFTVDRSSLPSQMNPAVGQRFQIRQQDGAVTAVTVSAISDANVTFDANHPLAGKDLTFDIQIVEIA